MRYLLTALCLALIPAAAARTPTAVLNTRPSAVQIITREGGAFRAVCSGAVVRLERGPRVLTAGHCVSEAPHASYWARDHQGRLWTLGLEEWAFTWPKADHAVFRTVATSFLPALNVAPRACQVGEDVFSWSGPLGLGLMLFRGEVSGVLSVPYDAEGEAALGGMTYSANLLTDGGASGSAVLNEAGEVTALLVGGWRPEIKLAGAFFAKLPR